MQIMIFAMITYLEFDRYLITSLLSQAFTFINMSLFDRQFDWGYTLKD